ncbi:MAG: carbonate dehydratase [Verrucomicrobia bacterium]|nr:carbonate dehydratase [Verrucomicrobiota bacterium]
MRELSELFAQNRIWAERLRTESPDLFRELAQRQAPGYLWIGCSDSRVPANHIVGLLPGEMFVHRNVANLVCPQDLNCQTAIEFAVDALKVRHIIVCGHYGCGGVQAVLRGTSLGLLSRWLEPVEGVRRQHAEQLAHLGDETRRLDRLCELNVIEQVAQVCAAACVQGAWDRSQALTVHGWIYALSDGLLRDLGVCVAGATELEAAYRTAVTARPPGGTGPEVTGGVADCAASGADR